MRPNLRLTILFSVVLLSVITIWFTNDHKNEQSSERSEQQAIQQQAMNKVLAEDLAMTTSLFVDQLRTQLVHWDHSSFTNEEFYDKFSQELLNHDQFEGFALIENGEILQSVGDISQEDLKKISHTFNGLKSSSPYLKNGNEHMLISSETDDNRVIVGEINLSFIKRYVRDLAQVADANGNLFIGGNDTDLDVTEPGDSTRDKSITEVVPNLGWKISVDSKPKVEDETHFIEHEAVIRFNEGVDGRDWIKQSELQLVKNGGPYYVVRDESKSAEQLVDELTAAENIDTAELNYYYTKQLKSNFGFKSRFQYRPSLPNDEFFEPYQWNLTQIFAESGWAITEGTNDVSIAVLDSGVDPNHEDLKDRILVGYNTFNDDGEFYDEHGHGTHVAGIIAASTNNFSGIAGVSWRNPILPVKVLDENAEGTTFEIANGIRWATDQGAKVINMSLGDSHDSKIMHEAIRYAYEKDVVLIAAAGNDNVDTPMYPAAYDEVLAVSAVDHKRQKAVFSNYGDHIAVAAPGEHIPSTFLDNHYVMMSGTSMAAPHVAGLAGLMRSINPKLTNEEIVEVIKYTTDDLGPNGFDPYYGYGEINISKALKAVANH